MAYAVIIQRDDSGIIQRDDYTLHQYCKCYPPHPSNSNNLAEYLGFRHIIQILINTHLQNEPIIIYGDSLLVIEQMFGTREIKEGMYTREAIHCKGLLPRFTNLKGIWIPAEKNKIVHKMIEVGKKKLRMETVDTVEKVVVEMEDIFK